MITAVLTFFGFCLGFFVAALAQESKRNSEKEEEQKEAAAQQRPAERTDKQHI